MNIISTCLSEVKIIEPKVFRDKRGFFFESFNAGRYVASGFDLPFVQDNFSRSHYGTLRGLHYQLHHPQGKLVTVINGAVFDVAIDIRIGSSNFGKWFGTILNDENNQQLYIPPGFAHGFYVLSESADFHYKCTDYYLPGDEYGLLWSDEDVGIAWPFSRSKQPIVSEKDAKYRKLSEIPKELLPAF